MVALPSATEADEGRVHAAKPLNIIIVGGSIAGLVAGILLKRNGHNVRILEKAASSEREGMAAGIGLSLKIREFFETEDDLKHLPMGISTQEVRILDKILNVRYRLNVGYHMTTWDTAYYRLRANYDGFKSGYCPEPPPARGTGTATYETGKQVTHVADEGGQMVAFVQDVASGEAHREEADLIIAADGGASAIRRQLYPDVGRDAPGYVLWRGTVPTTELSTELLEKIEGHALSFMGEYSYCVIYTVPGKDGTLEPGQRLINFAWYFWPSEPTLDEIMTDIDGHRHRTTVPKGMLKPEIWYATVQHARQMLPEGLIELLERITQPFVSVISSISAPKAAHFDNRLFLIGDALTQTQPNLGQGTNLAATAAIGLVDAIGPAGQGIDHQKLRQWESGLTSELNVMKLRSRAIASWFLESWFGFVRDLMPSLLATIRHKLFGSSL